MGILWSFLADGSGLVDFNNNASGLSDMAKKVKTTFADIMRIIMPIVLAVVLALGVFFCIKLGIAYAKTEKTEDREEAKKRLVGAVIGFSIGLVGAAIMWILFETDAFNSLF